MSYRFEDLAEDQHPLHPVEGGRLPSGWWIAPFGILGACFWVGLAVLIF